MRVQIYKIIFTQQKNYFRFYSFLILKTNQNILPVR